jgi:hypothetical protein
VIRNVTGWLLLVALVTMTASLWVRGEGGRFLESAALTQCLFIVALSLLDRRRRG